MTTIILSENTFLELLDRTPADFGTLYFDKGVECLQVPGVLFKRASVSEETFIENKESSVYGDVTIFLQELAAHEEEEIVEGTFDFYGEDYQGREGCSTISIPTLAEESVQVIKKLRQRVKDLESLSKENK